MATPPAPQEPSTGRSLLKSAGVVSAMTMLSRVLGLVRDTVIAHSFGASAATDAFFVAFKIPNFLRRLFAEGAFSQAFVPVLAEYKLKGPHEIVKDLVDRVAGRLGFVLLLVTVICMIASPLIIALFAPGFVGTPKFDLAADMLRITFPYLLLISLTAFAGGILNTYGRFGVPAITPVLLNISMIGAALCLPAYMPVGREIEALAWGVFIAGVLQLAFQLPFLAGLRLLPKPKKAEGHEGVTRILKLMAPAIFGVSVTQINLLVDTVIASFLITGSVTWLYTAERLTELPLGVIGIAIGTVILPSLSEKHAGKSREEFNRTIDWALRMTLLVGLPSALAIGLMAMPLMQALFEHGDFTRHDATMAAMALQAYALGIMCFMLIKVLAPGYYARQDTKTPVKYGIWTLVANMVLNGLLVGTLHLTGWAPLHLGLALASSVAAAMNATWLYRGLVRDGHFQPEPGWRRYGLQLFGGNALLGVVVWWLCSVYADAFTANLAERVGAVLIVVVAGMATYFFALFVLGLRPRHLRH